MPDRDLDDDALYALPPQEFVAARDALAAQARAAGDPARARRITALRRPSVAAWVVNTLARDGAAEVEQLLDLGGALRQAQTALAGEELRELSRRRQQVVAALARQAAQLAAQRGRPVSAAVAGEVEQTLRAALADPAAAEAVRAGRLTTALTYAGLGEGVAAAPARPAAARPASASPSERQRREQQRLEQQRREQERREQERLAHRRIAARAAAAARDDALRRVQQAEAELLAARAALDAAQQHLDELTDPT